MNVLLLNAALLLILNTTSILAGIVARAGVLVLRTFFSMPTPAATADVAIGIIRSASNHTTHF